MHVLGLTAFAHDSTACLLRDGQVIALLEEERVNRERRTGRFPHGATRWCLEQAGIGPEAVDRVAFFLRPDLLRARIAAVARDFFPLALADLPLRVREYLAFRRGLRRELRRAGLPASRLVYCEHHLAHAASAFYPSPFERAAILTVDGKGEWAATTLGVGEGDRVRIIEEIRYPQSLGYLYAAITGYLGYRPWADEGTTMALASYGAPTYRDAFDRLLRRRTDGSYRVDLDCFWFAIGQPRHRRRLERLLGPARRPDEPLGQRHRDVAASLQAAIEDAVGGLLARLHRRTGAEAVCLAGGVLLNAAMNGRLARGESPFDRHYFQPLASDQGTALGAALLAEAGAARAAGRPLRRAPIEALHLGPAFDDARCAAAVAAAIAAGAPLRARRLGEGEANKDAAIARAATEALTAGLAIGWFQGRLEAGPRALGARSILADPRHARARDHINARVKRREPFRPFAPAVLAERAAEWFDMPDGRVARPLRDMIVCVPVRRDQADRVPAIVHVDGTARVQVVDEAAEPRFAALVRAFADATGVPMLLNTSFNARGEPIVATPEDALDTFGRVGLDRLYIGDHEVSRA